ncbi:MAG: hypothetical protein WDZ83_14315 [Rhizobiaceae bacterium]
MSDVTVSVSEELRRVFELNALRGQSVMLRWPDLVQKATDTKLRCADLRAREKDAYAARFETRVEQERRRLIDQAGDVVREFKPWWAQEDRFSPADTLRQAQINVRERHHRRIAAIDRYERRELQAILDQSERQDAQRGQSRDAFTRAADSRPEIDRRISRHRNRER